MDEILEVLGSMDLDRVFVKVSFSTYAHHGIWWGFAKVFARRWIWFIAVRPKKGKYQINNYQDIAHISYMASPRLRHKTFRGCESEPFAECNRAIKRSYLAWAMLDSQDPVSIESDAHWRVFWSSCCLRSSWVFVFIEGLFPIGNGYWHATAKECFTFSPKI